MLTLLAGLALVLGGVRLTSDHLQQAFGASLRRRLVRVDRHPRRAVLVGAVTTALTQSATLVSTLAVGFVNIGMLSTQTALAVMLGASIGGTLLVQILAFHLQLTLPVLALSLALRSRHLAGGHFGGVLLGLGTLLLGQQLLLSAVQPLAQDPLAQALLTVLAGQPLMLCLLGVGLAAALQSSNAVTILALSLQAAHLLNLEQALEVMIWANVGSTVTTVLGAWPGDPAGRRVALGHLAVKLILAALCLPLVPSLSSRLTLSGLPATPLIAGAHIFFNVLALLALPLLPILDHLLRRLVPDRERPDGPRYLDPAALASPELAYGLAFRETVRIAEGVHQLYRLASRALEGHNVRLPVSAQEGVIDALVHDVLAYLGQLAAQIPQRHLTGLLDTVSELEALSDLCKRLARQPNKLLAKGQTLHPDSALDIRRLVLALDLQIQQTVTFLGRSAPERAANQAIVGELSVSSPQKWQQQRLAQLARLTRQQETQISMAMLMDVLSILEQVETGFDRLGRFELLR